MARVDRVVDGDTINVTVTSGTERLRLLGIDTPETNHPTKPVECFGPEATERLRQLAPAGTELRLERDTELRDRYGRLLVYAFTPDGEFVNEVLVREGFARTLPIDPNRAYRSDLATAESAARSERQGLWGACN